MDPAQRTDACSAGLRTAIKSQDPRGPGCVRRGITPPTEWHGTWRRISLNSKLEPKGRPAQLGRQHQLFHCARPPARRQDTENRAPEGAVVAEHRPPVPGDDAVPAHRSEPVWADVDGEPGGPGVPERDHRDRQGHPCHRDSSVDTPPFRAEWGYLPLAGEKRTPAEQGRERGFAARADRRPPSTARKESQVDVLACEI